MPRAIAIVIEVLILAAIMFCVLWGIRLILFDLVLGPRYKKVITMLLLAVGGVALVFFIGHLTAFYPALPG